jgi:hypothetical protein
MRAHRFHGSYVVNKLYAHGGTDLKPGRPVKYDLGVCSWGPGGLIAYFDTSSHAKKYFWAFPPEVKQPEAIQVAKTLLDMMQMMGVELEEE